MKKNLLVLGLFLILTFPAYKALRHLGMISGHDTEAAMFKAEEFFNAIKDGEFPVRWAKRLDYGLGQPTFTFTYVMPYFLMLLPQILGSGPIWAFKIIMSLSFPFSAFLAYLWLKKHFSFRPAFLAGLIYAYVPYHLANVYVRGAIGETVAACFLPLAFWGLDRVIEKPNFFNTAVAALTIAVVILSHPFYGLVFSVGWLGYLAVRFKKDKKTLMMAFMALVWGYVICAFYIVPAWTYKNLTFLDRLESYFMEKQYFVTLDRLIYSPWGFAGANELDRDPMSVQIGVVSLVLFLGWIIVVVFSRKARKETNFPVSVFFALASLLSVIMMLKISLPVWKLVPILQNLQFPWRLLFVTNLGTTYCAGFVLNQLNPIKIAELKKSLLFLGIIFIIILVNQKYWNVGRYFPFVDQTVGPIGYPGTLTMLLEETPVWHQRIQEANPYNFVQNAAGRAISLTSLVWKTNYHKFDVVTNEAIVMNDKTHYWPGWKVWVDGVETPTLDPNNKISQGLITFAVDSGHHIVETRLMEPTLNIMADIISLVSMGVALGILLLPLVRLKYNTHR